jgi:WD40 repeat protein
MPATARVVTLSPDGRRALAGFPSWPLRLFDVETAEEVRQYDGGASGTAVLALAYSPDGKKILAGGPNLALHNSRRVLVDSLILLDADSGRVLGRWRSEPGDVYRILFSRDGTQAFYTCDGILKVLNLKEGS